MSGEDNREFEGGLELPHQPLKWGKKCQLCPLAGAWHVKHLPNERKKAPGGRNLQSDGKANNNLHICFEDQLNSITTRTWVMDKVVQEGEDTNSPL